MEEESDDMLPARGILGIIALIVPIVSIIIVGALYVGISVLGVQGREATGPHVLMSFAGCPEAADVVAKRIAFMGLPDVERQAREGGFEFSARLPSEPVIAEAVPALLASPGRFEIRKPDGSVVIEPKHVQEVTVSMPFLDVPHTVVVLTREGAKLLRDTMQRDVDGQLEYWIDDEKVDVVKNMPLIEDGRVIVERYGLDEKQRMFEAAQMAAELSAGPLPCAVSVSGVKTL